LILLEIIIENTHLFLRQHCVTKQGQWAGGHFVFWAEYLGLIVISFVDAAKIDKGYGQYYQIGIIKYAFLD
jgi:hypothetical protein